MDSPRQSCTNCLCPLPVGVESGLCEVCSGTPVSASTVSSPAHQFAEDASSRSMHLSDLPIPTGGFSTTGHFPDARDDAPTADRPSDPVLTQPHPPGYELLGEISRGGMGVVYLARSRSRKDLYVAAKYLIDPTNLSGFQRFVVEFKSSPLKSDHVESVVGGDTDADPPYFFMEVAGGGTLARLVKKGGPLAPALAARWMKAIAAAVAEVHGRGVIHRDIKPGNILLKRKDGRDAEFVRVKGVPKGDEPPFDPDDYVPKLSDFGLAKRLDATRGLTVGSAVMGTLQYMPPEQLRNPQRGDADDRVGKRSDIYSLGATLYHLVCGRPPFDHESQLALMEAVARKDPPLPSAVRKDCPPKLEAIIVKAMEKNPRKRYQSAKELAEDLDRFENELPTKAP
ncbi:MAG TPA: serine/threonine-protein kinase, partial [Gemmataceae bacterium]|nr:serine/threonine-protein kinase [Gemmataceae bacterium]